MKYIHCKVCGSDSPRFMGLRGNLEYSGAPSLKPGQEHIVTNVVRCNKCGFVYTNPLILVDGQRGYERAYGYRSSADGVDPDKLFSFTMDLIGRYAKGKRVILDIGCGKGEFLAVAKERDWDVHGIEPSKDLADYAAEKYNLHVKQDSIENTGFRDSYFDVVTLNMVLEHLDEPRAALIEINRLLKNDGILFIEVPNMDGLMFKLATLYFRLNKKDWSPLLSPLHHPFHCYGYNMSSLRHLLESCNFKIKKAIIVDTSLRGIRNSALVNNLKRRLCRAAARGSGLIGKGDVLIVIATKISTVW